VVIIPKYVKMQLNYQDNTSYTTPLNDVEYTIAVNAKPASDGSSLKNYAQLLV